MIAEDGTVKYRLQRNRVAVFFGSLLSTVIDPGRDETILWIERSPETVKIRHLFYLVTSF